MSQKQKNSEAWPDAETQALLRAVGRQSPFVMSDSGPDCERLRAQAFRIMVLRPLRRLWRFGLGRLRRRLRAAPAHPTETAQELRTARE